MKTGRKHGIKDARFALYLLFLRSQLVGKESLDQSLIDGTLADVTRCRASTLVIRLNLVQINSLFPSIVVCVFIYEGARIFRPIIIDIRIERKFKRRLYEKDGMHASCE